MNARAGFTRMDESTKADWDLIVTESSNMLDGLPDRVIAHLRLLEGDCGGLPVDRYTHSLQAATLALNDGRDEEYIVCALLHDIGDTLGSYNHSDIAAAILKPFITEANLWMVQNHPIFQGYNFYHHVGMDRNMRDRFKEHPYYERTLEFIELYDNPAFNCARETYPITAFDSILRSVMAVPRNTVYEASGCASSQELSK